MQPPTGYVALLEAPLTREYISACVSSWLARFEKVEQVVPGAQAGATTMQVEKLEDVFWEKHLQLRVMEGEDFAWVYLSIDGRAIETTGWPSEIPEQIALCLDVLVELEGVQEIVDQANAKRLDELEKQGLI